MRFAMVVGVLVCASSVLADDRRDDVPVIVDRRDMSQQVQNALQGINDAIARTSRRDGHMKALLQNARAELEKVRNTLESAPNLDRRDWDRRDWDRRDRDRDERDRDRDRRRDQQVQPPPPPPQPVVYPMAPPQFSSLRRAIQSESFSANKLRVLEQATTAHYFICAQVNEVLNDFAFSQDKLQAARLLKPRILDPENKFKLYEAFTFPNDKEELKRILQ